MNIIMLAMRLLRQRDRLPSIREMLEKLAPESEVPDRTDFPVGSVEWLQDSLNDLLSSTGMALEVDGKYGEATREAVREYQELHDLKVDGWAGPETIASIVEELEKRA